MVTTMSKRCEGIVQHRRCNEDASLYVLYDSEGNKDMERFLCSLCVKEDREEGWDWREKETNDEV